MKTLIVLSVVGFCRRVHRATLLSRLTFVVVLLSLHSIAYADTNFDGGVNSSFDHGLRALSEGRMLDAHRAWEAAAVVGDNVSQYLLGQLYEQGNGVEKDLILAHMWYCAAARNQFQDASGGCNRMGDVLTADQRAESEHRARVLGATMVRADSPGRAASTKTDFAGNQEILVTQRLLQRLGYAVGKADGLMGRNTRLALVAFKRRTGLVVDDKINEESIAALRAQVASIDVLRNTGTANSDQGSDRADQNPTSAAPRQRPKSESTFGLDDAASKHPDDDFLDE